tara:strand:- start:1498 stop:2106 length:609 start_codon:yes stop_codon:yes gene_type:complete
MKIIKSLIGLFLYLLILIIIYIIHIKFFSVKVVLFSAILDVFIATIITFLIIFLSNFSKIFTTFEKLQMLIIYLLVGYSIALSVPTIIDRSLSFYILEKIDQRGGGVKEASLEKIFKEEYISEHRLIDVRLTEQLESGTVIIENNCVKITNKGKIFVYISSNFRKHLLPKKRLLKNEYTDALIDIFKNSKSVNREVVDYECK